MPEQAPTEQADEVLAAIHQASAAMLQSVMAHDPAAVALAAVGIAVTIAERIPEPQLKAVILKSLDEAAKQLRQAPTEQRASLGE
ncbi:MAG: hypothetical protein HQL47_08410 [Gammaproteobacteria bacterium]|nr:hypothetical protein [Gammaproteobacteria bacterium]